MLREQSLQLSNISWPDEFAKIVGCRRCSVIEWPNLLRDEGENVLQPGYVGARYCATRLLLVGQNPGVNIVGLAAKRATRLYEQEKGKSEGFHVLGLDVVQWLCAPSAAAKDGFDARTLCVMRNKAEANQLCEHISRDCR